MYMQNTNSCRSCDGIIKTRTVKVLGKELKLKNYICSADGIHYKQKPEEIRLQLSICPTSFCNAACPFCIATNTEKKQCIDLEKLKVCLQKLKDENIVRGVSFTGGEPFTDIGVQIKDTEGWSMIMPCCITNGYQGYFPTKSAYDEGGYESRSSSYRSNVAELLVAGGKELLAEL